MKDEHSGRKFVDLSKLLDKMLADIAKTKDEVAGLKADMKKNDLLTRVQKLEKGK